MAKGKYSVYLDEQIFQKLLPNRCNIQVDKSFDQWQNMSHNENQNDCSALLLHSVHEGYYSWWDIDCNAIMTTMVVACQKCSNIGDVYRSAIHNDPSINNISSITDNIH